MVKLSIRGMRVLVLYVVDSIIQYSRIQMMVLQDLN